MKTNCSQDANGGMTLLEVLVVIVVLIILMALVVPLPSTPRRPLQTFCMNNLQQIGVGFQIYAEDNHGKFPISTSITHGGTLEYLDRNQTFPHYQKLSANTNGIRFLVCPADKNRRAAMNFETLTDTNISYFLNADVSTNNPVHAIMAGDRHLQVNGQPVRHGTLAIDTNMDKTWTPELHQGNGILGFVDGHAALCRSNNLNSVIQRQGLASMKFSVP